VAAKYILAALAIVFFILAFTRGGGRDRTNPRGRTWLLIAVLFGLVSAWLFYQG
jgi:hypothetical protein